MQATALALQINFAGDEFLQLHEVGREFSDAFRSLLRRHRIFVQEKAELPLVQLESLQVRAFRLFGSQLALDRLVRFGKLFHQLGTDGEKVATRELEDLASVAKA